MKGIMLMMVFFVAVGIVTTATISTASFVTTITSNEQAFDEKEKATIATGSMEGVTADKLKKEENWNFVKQNPNALGDLRQEQMKIIENDQSKLNDVVQNDLSDITSQTAKNYPDTPEAADALKASSQKVNNLPPEKVTNFVKEGKLDQKVLDHLDLHTESWKSHDAVNELRQGLAQPGKYKFTQDSKFIQTNRDVLLKNTASNNPAIQGPTNPANIGERITQAGGQQGHGSGEGSGASGEQGKGQSGAGREGKPQGAGSGGDLSQLGGLLQGVAALIGVLKPTPEPQEPKKDIFTPSEKPEVATCAKAGGSFFMRNIEQCDHEIQVSDGPCCSGASQKRASQASAQQDVTNAKQADATQLAFALSGKNGEVITSADGSTKQDMAKLNQASNKVIPTTDTIFVTDGLATNLYTLKNTKVGIENYYGIIIFDATGITKLSAAEDFGALTMDRTGVFLWEAPGITVYDAEKDTYETNTAVFAPQYGLWVKVHQEEPTAGITGKFGHALPVAAGFTFGHNALSNLLKNAIDASVTSRGDADIIILAKGDEDIELLGNIGFFPLFIRDVAKGSTHIIYDMGVGVERAYLIKDNKYEYKIVQESGTTKVKTNEGKVIEDSGAASVRLLNPKQKRLLYGG